jgi:glycosyltransferase involved in cell wall biosynthesis
VRVVPNGSDALALSYTPPSQRQGKEVLFVGAFFWPPNARAARFLVREVLPRVRSVEPLATLTLCGKSPGVDVALLRRPGVEVTGTVPSVAPYLRRASVYALALFEGAGSSLKVLEALACGVPLVSTAVGARGYPLLPGEHYEPAEDAEGFARAILAVFANPAAFDARAQRGRAFAEAYSWGRVGADFAQAVALVAKSSTRS